MQWSLVSLLFLLLATPTVHADWFDDALGSISDGIKSAGDWVKDTAGPAVREKFDSAKKALQDPENHRNVQEWISDKANKASQFAQEEIVPELKKIYDAATADKQPSQEQVSTSWPTTH